MKTKTQKPVSLKKTKKSEARVLIAKDVIAQLKAEKLSPISGTYFLPTFKTKFEETKIEPEDVDKTQLQSVLKNRIEICDVCAKGALFACQIRKFNDLKVNTQMFNDEGVVGFQTINKQLGKYFSRGQLELIEYAFEDGDIGKPGDYGISDAMQVRALMFGHRHRDDYDRMTAIMENLIKNNGTFKPERIEEEEIF